MNMTTLIANWRTTSLGATTIIGAVVHLVFAVLHHTDDENTWITSLLTIVGGFGLIVAGDGALSAKAHADSTAAIQAIQSKVEATAAAVQTGDTSLLGKPATSTSAGTSKG
jgi:hypothetical protein